VGRNVRLTDAGRELVRHAEILLANLEEAQTALERVGAEPHGTVEMAVFESVAGTLLPPVLSLLAARHPDLIVNTRERDPEDALEDLAIGDLDLAFYIDYPHAPGPQPDGVTREHVCTDWLRLVVPEDDEITDDPVDLRSVAERDFIASPGHVSCGRCVVQACREVGFEPRVRHQLDDYPAALRLVAGGAGVSLVPALGLVDAPAGIRVLDLARPVCRSVELIYRSTSADRPGLKVVREAVHEVAHQLGLDQTPVPVGG
jgi:DNA-binding transcriptional LysR family regulator